MVKDNFNNIDHIMKMKSDGNDSFSHKKYRKAVNEYTQMLELLSIEEKNCNLLSVALSNRGTSLFNIKHFIPSFLDLYYAVSFNQENEKYQNKLMKVVLQIDSLPLSYSKYVDDLLEKEFINEECKKKLEEIKQNIVKENVNISNDINVTDIQNKGKGIITKNDIKKNTVVIEENPIIFIQTNHFQEYCSYCGNFTYNRFYCSNCFYGYCSIECYNKNKDTHLCFSYVIKNDLYLTISHMALTLFYYNQSIIIIIIF